MKGIWKICSFLSLMLSLLIVLSSCTTQNIVPSVSHTDIPQGTLSIASTETSTITPENNQTAIPSITPLPQPTLDVKIDYSFENCGCNGQFQVSNIILKFGNGTPPYNISGQKPVNSTQAIFPVISGSSFLLDISSSDGLLWGCEIEVPNAGSCQPSNSCKNSNGGCTEKVIQVCEDVTTITKVCVKWTGNGNKCLEWEEQEVVNKVCESKIVCE